ncbi:MAG: ABC transporter permease, partial [Syntrophobacteraceae bacterium CG23_combo_of_CG06-09_8_20_14_all_50_8]
MVIGVVLGVVVAAKRGGKFDTFNVSFALIFYSVPTFWIGLLLILQFSSNLGWLPSGRAFPISWTLKGFPEAYNSNVTVSDASLLMTLNFNFQETSKLIMGYVWHIILPFLTLTLYTYGGFLLLTRATMIDALTEDYIVTARAKGLPEIKVLYKHALKNASLPLITSAVLSFAFMVSGAVITETVFNYP